MSWYRDQLEQWLKTIDVKADRVLDIGGGALPVKDRVRSWDVKEYVIADNSLEKSKAEVDIEWDINLPKDFEVDFNAIFCLEVFEYVYNPIVAIHNIYNALDNNGKLYITFPFVYPMHEPFENDFLRYTYKGATRILWEGGFEKSKIKIQPRIDRSGLLRAFYAEDGMHPVKGLPIHNSTGWLVEATK